MKKAIKMTKIKNIIKKGLLVVTTILTVCGCGMYEGHYTREAIVTDVNNDVITVEDTTHNVWELEGSDFKVGDKVRLSMDNKGTHDNIYDDEITNINLYKQESSKERNKEDR